jgi:N-acyl-D-aspartate/D-glutamate deacylase
MTDVPARFFGISERGRIVEGWHADLVVLDPATVGAGEFHMHNDLPGNSPRLYADAFGIERVYVNGTCTVVDGTPTGNLPGSVIRSGTDTETTGIPADA